MAIRSVHITNYYHKNSGGISTSYNNLLAAAERHRRYVRLIVPGENEAIEDINEFAKIYYVPARHSPIFDKRYRMIMPWQYMVKGSTIREILLSEKPDMIEICDKYSLSMMGPMIGLGKFSKLGRPMMIHFSCERMDDNVASFLTGGRVGKWFSRHIIGDYILPNYDFHIANSHYTAQEFFEAVGHEARPGGKSNFRELCWKVFRSPKVDLKERVFVCPRGVDAKFYSPKRRSSAFRQKLIETAKIPLDSVILLYAGRLSPEKNIGLLVEIMKRLARESSKDFRLLIAGAGPMAKNIEEQGEKIAKRKVVQLGHLDKESLADHYANADVFVHPNPREPFGIAPLEAMASGTPVVAPNSGGILSYATDANAWLVEPDGKSFASAVLDVFSDEQAKLRKIANALETATQNSREVATNRLFSTYDRLFEDFVSRRPLFTDLA